MGCQFGQRGRPQVSVVVGARNVEYPSDTAPGPRQRHADRVAFVAVFFPVVEVFENLVFNPVGDALAYRSLPGNQGYHPPRRFRRTAMVV